MKKLLIIFPLILVMFLFGCSNDGRLLARNLDNTITNLLYSISNLDIIDQATLQKVSSLGSVGVNQSSEYQTVSADYCIDDEDDGINNEEQEEYDDKSEEVIEDNYENEEIIEDYKENEDENNEKELVSNETTENDNEPETQKNNQEAPTLRDNDANFTLPENNKRLAIGNTSISDNQNLERPTAVSSLNESSTKMQNLIDELIKIRTIIMLYISDLYNGTIKPTSEDIHAIEAYLNIIKESTAFLKSNNGTVANHLNEATSYDSTNLNLVNAHIIRATEALNSRSAKLEAAIVSTYNIASILKSYIDNQTQPENTSDDVLNADAYGPMGIASNYSPNYSMNNPYNMGINGSYYNQFYNYGYPNYYGYGNNNYPYSMGNYPYGYGMNYGYSGFNYPNNYGYGTMFNGGYGGYNTLNNYGYEPIANSPLANENITGLNAPINPNVNYGAGVMPNILTGLVTKDDQQSINNIT